MDFTKFQNFFAIAGLLVIILGAKPWRDETTDREFIMAWFGFTYILISVSVTLL